MYPSRWRTKELSHLMSNRAAALQRRRELIARLRPAPTEGVQPAIAAAAESTPMSESGTIVSGDCEATLPTDEHDHHSWTLAELIGRADASVRLINCSGRNTVFSDLTIKDYIEDATRVRRLVLATPAMGRKTFDELEGIIRSCLVDPTQFEPDRSTDLTPAPDTDIPEGIAHLTLAELVQLEPVSVRLFNCFTKDTEAGAIPLRLVVEDRAQFLKRVKSIRSLGRKSLAELISVVERVTVPDPTTPGKALEDCLQDSARQMIPTGTDQQTSLADTAVDSRNVSDNPRLRLIAEQAVSDALAVLNERHWFVLNSRYGLEGAEPLTLEEISQQVHVTRERVRQVENKALGVLRKGRSRLAFQALLAERENEAWKHLAEGFPILTLDLWRANRKGLDPLFVLSADVVDESLEGWLNRFAVRTPAGWVRSLDERKKAADDARTVSDFLQDRRTPVLVETISAVTGLSANEIEGALQISSNARTYAGYAHVGHLGSQAKRTIDLHRIATTLPDRIFDVKTLASLYRKAHPNDDVSSRMVVMQMEEAPHLFGCLFDAIWFAIPIVNAMGTRAATVPHERGRHANDEKFEANSLARWLFDRLQAEGPSRMVDLREQMALEFGSRYSSSSVGAILHSIPVFRRVAPGLFDIYSGNSDDWNETSPPAALLTERMGRYYAYARFGGAPPDYYPFWGYALERHLCEWARADASTPAFRSLLHVAEPDSWPGDCRVKAEWLVLKDKYGAWELSQPRRLRLGSRIPRPEDLFAALVHLQRFGTISWLSANRTAQNKLDNHSGADTVAILIALGAVVGQSDWQLPHPSTPAAREVLAMLEVERCRAGRLRWDERVMSNLLDQVSISRLEGTWVPADEWAELMGSRQETPKAWGYEKAEHIELTGIEDMFQSDDWNSLFSTDETEG